MWRRRPWLFCAWALLFAALLLHAQGQDAPLLKVVLADGRSQSFTRAQLDAIPTERAPARLRDGAPFTVTGVSVT